MRPKRFPFMLLFTVLFSGVIVAMGLYFVLSARSSLWMQNVTDILEVTAQGRHALDTYVEKELDSLHLLAVELAECDADDEEAIRRRIRFPSEEEVAYICLVGNSGKAYTNSGDKQTPDEELEAVAALSGVGIRKPFLDPYTGVRKISVYERFAFADGTDGFLQKTMRQDYLAERFSLSFFDNTGFSYVVDASGAVLMRSLHRNSNRTFQNLFDIVDLEGNEAEVVESFRKALAEGKKGVANLRYEGEYYAFCYVPMEEAEDWYLVSIIPDSVIMKQANLIIVRALILCAVILAGLTAVGLGIYFQIKRHHRETEQLAFYDKLTGLYRYEKLCLDGEKIFGGGENCAVLYMDVIAFKLINDLEGYAYGDRLLNKIADVLRQDSGEGDLLSRVAGDDFILLTRRSDKESVEKLCEELLGSCADLAAEGRPFKARIGVCRSEDAPEAENVNGLIDRARMAQGKIGEGSAKYYYFYNQELRADLLRAAEIENEAEKALEQGEFVYYIQPKYRPDGGKVLGGEALVRWIKPDGKIVSPGEFIPLFEQDGFICTLDKYIFGRVCKDLRARLDAGLPVAPVSVNVSRIDLFREEFVAEYARIKEESGIPDRLLELELTESIMLDNTEEVCAILSRLRTLGFRCSIDDFGSGYSSLNALKDLPADVLKLDGKFLESRDDSGKNETIVRTIIEMAKRLSMTTVAEGVETEKQLEFLNETGCDMIQGFVFSKPLPPEEFYAKLS